jgi:hypothetical protein
MDELDLLRKLRSDTGDLDNDVRTAGRTALIERIEATPVGEPSVADPSEGRHRRHIFTGLGIAAATGLAITLVFTDLVGLAGWRGGADPAAAAVLNRAAEEMSFLDSDLDAGEYLLVKSNAVHVSSSQSEGGPLIDYYARETSELYVPADRSDEWVWIRPHTELVEVITPGGEDAIKADFQRTLDEWGDEPERLRAAGGAFYGSTRGGPWGGHANLPRDPYRLLNHIYRVTLGAGPSPDGEALVFIADTLRQGTAPADVRKALLQAATMIPGVTVVDEQANLDGVTGVAIGRLEDREGFRQELIIDPDTGRLIGERQVVVGASGIGLQPGDISQWSSIQTSIVSSAPAGGTPNGAMDVMGCVPLDDTPGSWQCPPPKEQE